MKPTPEVITIKQIAEMAGVSVGTVDRVLHNRGKVSEINLKKINEILNKFDYQPNIIASTLASKKRYQLAAVTPFFQKGEYWESVMNGINAAIGEMQQFGISIEILFFDQYDNGSIKTIEKKISDNEYDGVLLAVLFKNEFTKLSSELTNRNIPYVFMDFNLTDQKPISFYGTDSISGGKLSARMLLSEINITDNILIVLMNMKNGLRSNQSLNREKGFLEYLELKKYGGTIHQIHLEYKDKKKNNRILKNFFSRNSVKGVIFFNSSCYIVAHYFEDNNLSDIVLVGYDGVPENIRMMKAGFIDILITQRPYYQGYESAKSLCNYLLKKTSFQTENYIPLDILVRENVEFYNQQ